ncbi:lipopolysaccharide biosynthesis protein [Marivirga sp. S37H4]|uniref:Lipopolysaccharide biosynthesis protein n=1 Tax=Marivirga aurantiaca TaxID=2802615 RepID=A0A935CBG2_9BACT|nr:lipopolysaccharide biosynthesis protein [Marivirga aurantiaca]MBK6267069.1 lipopolysaccharide biosynthesis protein [Marivirga aurantiaca]
MDINSLKEKALKGMLWSSIEIIFHKGFDFLVKLLLAKLLFPEEFGVVGMAVVFTSFISVLNEFGIGAALIQRKDEDLNDGHYSTAFWSGIIWSIILFIVATFLIAPVAASFYEESLLVKVIPALSLSLIPNSMNLIHKARLIKDLNFRKIAFISNSAYLITGLISLLLAYLEFGIWALIFNSIAFYFLAAPIYFFASRWRPRFFWSKECFKDIIGFGLYSTGTQVLGNITSNIDYLIVGKIISAGALGAYSLAFLLTDIVRSQIMSILNKVMYPIYSKLQGSRKEVKEYYIQVIRYNVLVLYPIMLILIMEAEQIILVFLGDKWIDSIIPLQILSVSVLFHVMVSSNTVLIRGLGKPKLEMNIQLFKTIFLYIPSITILTYSYGIIGTSWAIVFNKFISVFIAQHFLKKLIGITFYDIIRSIKTVLLITIFIGVIIYLNNLYLTDNLYINLIIIILLYSMLYYRYFGKEVVGILVKMKARR